MKHRASTALRASAACLITLHGVTGAFGQEAEPVPAPPAAAASAAGTAAPLPPAPAEVPKAPDAPEASQPPDGETRFEGALGLVMRYGAAFAGSSDVRAKPSLAGFLRWGRFTISGAGGFTTRRQDGVDRGVSAELLRRQDWRLSLALRHASGRDEGESTDLAGMGEIKDTLRAQLGLRWTPVPEWSWSLRLSQDLLNRGGGHFITGGVSRTWRVAPGQRVSAGLGLTFGGSRYMQTWHGVSEDQARASGYPVYHPGAGMRDAELNLTWRIELASRWAGFLGVNYTEWLDAARRSPLTRDASAPMLVGGLARRF